MRVCLRLHRWRSRAPRGSRLISRNNSPSHTTRLACCSRSFRSARHTPQAQGQRAGRPREHETRDERTTERPRDRAYGDRLVADGAGAVLRRPVDVRPAVERAGRRVDLDPDHPVHGRSQHRSLELPAADHDHGPSVPAGAAAGLEVGGPRQQPQAVRGRGAQLLAEQRQGHRADGERPQQARHHQGQLEPDGPGRCAGRAQDSATPAGGSASRFFAR